jgi:DNA-binding response OmpR family regulator
MNSPRRILIIDKASDRKERINALKKRGYGVFPALKVEEARSRCMRGGYDLIVINAGDEQELAIRFGDELRKQCPQQLVLLRAEGDAEREYAVGPDLNALLEKVDDLLQDETVSPDYAKAA